MKLDMRLALGVFISLVLIQGASSLEIGGGSSASLGAESIAAGSLVADETGAVNAMSFSGTASHLGVLRFVQDRLGKRAEMLFNVKNPVGEVGYFAKFTPSEGHLRNDVQSVSASQSALVSRADMIELHSAANYSGSGAAAVNLSISSTENSKASFSGTTQSWADAGSALARIEGTVAGSVYGYAGYGCVTRVRDSLGQKIEGSLAMMATCRNGTGDIGGISRFSVLDGEKIGAAIDASWDGDIINVARGFYNENLVMDKNLTLIGAGPSNTVVDGQKNGSVITIGMNNSDARVALSGMTLQNGNASSGGGICNYGTMTAANSIIITNSAEEGGGIYNKGTATIAGCSISGNTADRSFGGGICNSGTATITNSQVFGNSGRYGGGIYIFSGCTASVANCTIKENSAKHGGGIFGAGTTTVINSSVSGNSAERGGAVYSFSTGKTTITNSTISGNSAEDGGAVYNGYGKTNVTGCTISENLAAYGGGISNSNLTNVVRSTISGNTATLNGGGIINFYGTTNVAGSTISGNSAMHGGGIYIRSDAVNVAGSTISGNSAIYGGGIINTAGTANLTGSTISGNIATYGGGICTNGILNMMDSIVSSNSVVQSGGGIYNSGNLSLGGTSKITGNTAMYGYGGGIYSTNSSLVFNGTDVFVMKNKAYLPASSGVWHRGYGVYLTKGTPSVAGGFDPSKQVTGNSRA